LRYFSYRSNWRCR